MSESTPVAASAGTRVFDTPVGRCAISWRGDRVSRFALPGRGLVDTGDEPPPWVVRACARVVSVLCGDARDDLRDLPLDLDAASPFERSIYEVARGIEPGTTLTYGEVAGRVGAPGAARAVGRALGRNPIPMIVPCHRVLGAGRWIGGFSAPGGADTKQRLLSIEARHFGDQPGLF